MISSRHPAFAKLASKIDRAERELQQIETFLSTHAELMAAGDWGATSATALGIHNVYNGIEDVLLNIANDVDGLVPTGQTLHQDLLDQMSADIPGTRPPVIDAELYLLLTELKGFRHVVRHRYGFDLDRRRVTENVDRVRAAFPRFTAAIVALEAFMTADAGDDTPGSDLGGGTD